jgi:hypothetical protein
MASGNRNENEEERINASTGNDRKPNPSEATYSEHDSDGPRGELPNSDEDIADAILLSPELWVEVRTAQATQVEAANIAGERVLSSETSTSEFSKLDSLGRSASHMELYEKLPPDRQRFAEIGGAVASVVLGAWSIAGAFLTPWSIINSLMAILLGFWGLTSPRRNWAVLGILLAFLGLFISGIHVLSFDWSFLFPPPEETEFDF